MPSEHVLEPLDYLYEELPPEKMAAVRQHLADCPRCRKDMRSIRETVKAYRLSPAPTPPGGLAERTANRALAAARVKKDPVDAEAALLPTPAEPSGVQAPAAQTAAAHPASQPAQPARPLAAATLPAPASPATPVQSTPPVQPASPAALSAQPPAPPSRDPGSPPADSSTILSAATSSAANSSGPVGVKKTGNVSQTEMEEEFARFKAEVMREIPRGWRSWLYHPAWTVAASVIFLCSLLIHLSPRMQPRAETHYIAAAPTRSSHAAQLLRDRERLPPPVQPATPEAIPLPAPGPQTALYVAEALNDPPQLSPEANGKTLADAASVQTPAAGKERQENASQATTRPQVPVETLADFTGPTAAKPPSEGELAKLPAPQPAPAASSSTHSDANLNAAYAPVTPPAAVGFEAVTSNGLDAIGAFDADLAQAIDRFARLGEQNTRETMRKGREESTASHPEAVLPASTLGSLPPGADNFAMVQSADDEPLYPSPAPEQPYPAAATPPASATRSKDPDPLFAEPTRPHRFQERRGALRPKASAETPAAPPPRPLPEAPAAQPTPAATPQGRESVAGPVLSPPAAPTAATPAPSAVAPSAAVPAPSFAIQSPTPAPAAAVADPDASSPAPAGPSDLIVMDFNLPEEPPQFVPRPKAFNPPESVNSLIGLIGMQIASGEWEDAWKSVGMLNYYDEQAAKQMTEVLRQAEAAAGARTAEGTASLLPPLPEAPEAPTVSAPPAAVPAAPAVPLTAAPVDSGAVAVPSLPPAPAPAPARSPKPAGVRVVPIVPAAPAPTLPGGDPSQPLGGLVPDHNAGQNRFAPPGGNPQPLLPSYAAYLVEYVEPVSVVSAPPPSTPQSDAGKVYILREDPFERDAFPGSVLIPSADAAALSSGPARVTALAETALLPAEQALSAFPMLTDHPPAVPGRPVYLTDDPVIMSPVFLTDPGAGAAGSMATTQFHSFPLRQLVRKRMIPEAEATDEP